MNEFNQKLQRKLKEIESSNQNIKLPTVVEFDYDAFHPTLKIADSKKFTCGVFKEHGYFTYFETDKEYGFISMIKEFASWELLEIFINNHFLKFGESLLSLNSDNERIIEFIKFNNLISIEQSHVFADELVKHEDLCKEFINYITTNNLCKPGEQKVLIKGYTSERLINESNLSIIDAYIKLMELDK